MPRNTRTWGEAQREVNQRSFNTEEAGARTANERVREKPWSERRCECCPSLCRNNPDVSLCLGMTFAICSIIVILVVVPLTFSYVEYNEYALKKDKIQNTVELDEVYENGAYSWGPSFEPLTFSRQYKRVSQEYAIFPDNGLEFKIGVTFFYKIQKDKVGQIYKKFGTNIGGQVLNRANAKIKNEAPAFTLEQFITERESITLALWQGLISELDEVHVDVPFDKFFLTTVSIPPKIKEKDLAAAVQKQRNIEEQNRQLATLVKKETEKLEEQINANITLIHSHAEANVVRIENEAEATAEKITAQADGFGLQNLFSKINVTLPLIKEKYIAYFAFLDSSK